jgi:RNA polymerase sigma-70 factor, ECF subfamily
MDQEQTGETSTSNQQAPPDPDPPAPQGAKARADAAHGNETMNIQLLARYHGDALYRWALRLRRNPSDAMDLVQDTYERALRGGVSMPAQNARAWLFVIMKNLFLDQCRARKRRGWMASSDRISDLAAPDEEIEPPWASLTTEEVRECVAGLDRSFREVYTLHALEGLSYAEIATRLRLSPKTIGTRIFRARHKLRQALNAQLVRKHGMGGDRSRVDTVYAALAA